ncbi:unnamed protein product, partial [Urochloa humidicola]
SYCLLFSSAISFYSLAASASHLSNSLSFSRSLLLPLRRSLALSAIGGGSCRPSAPAWSRRARTRRCSSAFFFLLSTRERAGAAAPLPRSLRLVLSPPAAAPSSGAASSPLPLLSLRQAPLPLWPARAAPASRARWPLSLSPISGWRGGRSNCEQARQQEQEQDLARTLCSRGVSPACATDPGRRRLRARHRTTRSWASPRPRSTSRGRR